MASKKFVVKKNEKLPYEGGLTADVSGFIAKHTKIGMHEGSQYNNQDGKPDWYWKNGYEISVMVKRLPNSKIRGAPKLPHCPARDQRGSDACIGCSKMDVCMYMHGIIYPYKRVK